MTHPAPEADIAHARALLGSPDDALEAEERRVLESIAAGSLITQDAGDVADDHATTGDRLSDRVAAVGGSWGFIGTFVAVLFGWMLLNSGAMARFGVVFDPYPFIFLNLMLSMLAAIQAPVIMMSQNRQAAKDRLAARLDYETNLRAEIDILRLHRKLDQVVIARLDAIDARLDGLAKAIDAR